ncbi:NADPH-dependent FMN reductase [Teichococcus aestuarii]|uniref:NADPH-dependent FMN reductase n=1 Tax=Teichococcus aestuarii TaxID=568898 RepID=UPI003609A3DB
MTRPLSVVTLCGSLRAGSYNAALQRTLPELAPEGMTLAALEGLGDIPLYNSDVQAQGFPAAVTAMGEAIAAADGIIIVTPEYNYSIPGVLKNGIDWLSRLPDTPFAGKPMAIQSASMSVLGGVRAQYHLRQVAVFLDARVLNKPEVMVASVQQRVQDGRLTDEGTREVIRKQLAAFAAFIGAANA